MDYKTVKSKYDFYNAEIDKRTDKVADKLDDIYAQAFSMIAAEMIENAADIAIYSMNLANPKKWFGEGFSTGMDLKEAVKKLAVSTMKLAGLSRAFDTQFPALEDLAEDIRTQTVATKTMLDIIKKMIVDKNSLTLDDAMLFLERYGNFTPSVTPEQIVEYKSRMELLITQACDTIFSADTNAGAIVATTAAGTNPFKIEVLPHPHPHLHSV